MKTIAYVSTTTEEDLMIHQSLGTRYNVSEWLRIWDWMSGGLAVPGADHAARQEISRLWIEARLR